MFEHSSHEEVVNLFLFMEVILSGFDHSLPPMRGLLLLLSVLDQLLQVVFSQEV